MREIQIFHDAVSDVCTVAAGIKKKSRKIIGTLCSYAPEELIDAAGFHPLRLFPSNSKILLAEQHLQAYCCSPVRGVLEDSLSGRLDFLDGTVFPHTCDSIQRLSDVWRLNNRYEFFADVSLPAKFDTPSSARYLRDVLVRFKTDLETASGKKITDAALAISIKKFNLIRKNLSKLYLLKAVTPGLISGADLSAIVKGAMVMDRDAVVKLLPAIVGNLEKKQGPQPSGKRLILSGSICDSQAVYAAIEDAGGLIVGDDLCLGQRWFDCPVPDDQDPITAIAQRLMDRMACPAKHAVHLRSDTLVSLVRKNKADGVIFMLQKFCDPHAFDYPWLKQVLDRENIRHLLVEMDDPRQSLGQLSTRVETFVHYI